MGWVRVWTPEEVFMMLDTGLVTDLSMDFDLDLWDRPRDQMKCGLDVMNELLKRVCKKQYQPFRIIYHTDSIVGEQLMRRVHGLIIKEWASQMEDE